MTTPETDYTLAETAEALKVSTRWIRDRIKAGADPENADAPFVEHIRRGNKIMFTSEQVEKLRHSDTQAAPVPVVESITTGRKKRAS
ncbi:hypothetical protein [Nocardioides terrigena]|uniref:hypothetical protein n=1 Tax=Nocardioides terrigena TaxID=424797 RepID=UPI000D3173EA|nr:hypothetical protein [Nocardioides terrigena]